MIPKLQLCRFVPVCCCNIFCSLVYSIKKLTNLEIIMHNYLPDRHVETL